MTDFPLIGHGRPDAVFAYRKGRTITAAQFLAEAAALAAGLPTHAYVINLCLDRYRFAVALAAALMRGQISLMLPNEARGVVEQIAGQFPDVYCLTDSAFHHPSIPVMPYPERVSDTRSSPKIPAFPANQPAALVFTSGSTGLPMPNLKSWGLLVRSTRAAGARFSASARPGAVLLGTVPQHHMYGLESTVLLAMQQGMALHHGRPFYPGDICASLQELPRPRILVTTPIHLRALVADGAALPAADFLLCATAPLAPQLASDAEACFGAPLYEIYGCSEAGQVATRRTVETAEWRCFDGMRLRQDERGTWVGGDLFASEVLLNDVIELRAPDRFLLHGRTADLVNIAGKRTSLAHLNYHLNSIAGVHDGVFVMPDGEGMAVTRLTAFVVAPGLDPNAIISALRERIDAAFLPRPLYLVARLPRNATGKLPREAVIEMAAQFAER